MCVQELELYVHSCAGVSVAGVNWVKLYVQLQFGKQMERLMEDELYMS